MRSKRARVLSSVVYDSTTVPTLYRTAYRLSISGKCTKARQNVDSDAPCSLWPWSARDKPPRNPGTLRHPRSAEIRFLGQQASHARMLQHLRLCPSSGRSRRSRGTQMAVTLTGSQSKLGLFASCSRPDGSWSTTPIPSAPLTVAVAD